MPILTAADQANFFPLVDLPAAKIEAAIAFAQTLIERAIGRRLEISEYTELKRIGAGVRSTALNCLPVANDLPQVVKVRSNDEADWQTLGFSDYEIQYGRLRIKNRAFPLDQVEISYWAGIDFSHATQEIYNLKAALGQYLTRIYQEPGEPVPSSYLDAFRLYRSRGV
jgi:hypothetical protein